MTGLIAWFEELGKDDVAIAGGKGANLGELTRAGLPVPPGFVITAEAYLRAIEVGGVRDELRAVFAQACETADDPAALAETAERLKALVAKAGVPASLQAEALAASHRLGADVPVAVRSSATAEDTAGTSFAGMHQTFAGVVGDTAVLERLVDCWASLYHERVISYRSSQGLTAEPAIAVVVQQLVDAELAGVLFTADPSTGDRSRIVIEAAFGLGEVVVGGQIEPDTYVLDKHGPRLLQVRVGRKGHKVVRADAGIVRAELTPDAALRQVLADAEVVELARLGLAVEAHYRGCLRTSSGPSPGAGRSWSRPGPSPPSPSPPPGSPSPPSRAGAWCSKVWPRRRAWPVAGYASSPLRRRVSASGPARCSSRG
jgi:pyruvate,water dikinase